MNFLNGYKGQANGNILVSSFVAIDPSGNFLFRQASSAVNGGTSSDTAIGISQAGTYLAPNVINAISLTNTGTQTGQNLAAIAGLELQIYGPGDICWLTVGTGGGVVPGSFLGPDGAGQGGVVAAGGGGTAQARSFQSGNAGDLIQVIVLDHKMTT